MSHSPATPSKKPSVEAMHGDPSSTGKPVRGSAIIRSSLHEPSPASTYGETTAGDSIPATPQDVTGQDQSAAMVNSMRSFSLNDSIDPGSGSPFLPRAAKNFVRAEQNSLICRDYGSQAGSSPSEKRSMRAESDSLIKQESLEQGAKTPAWRNPGAFIQGDSRAAGQGEDPFVAARDPAIDLTGTNPGGFRPREDRVNIPITADTAQAMLPPNACVFVANLLQAMSDEQLERSVAAAFARFGQCWVKIRRDNKGMPFAFVQYQHASDAQRAITMGRGLIIDGRACRTEVAKVNRSLYLSKIAGGDISEAEAREVLAPYGAMEKLWYCSQTDKEMFRLPEGVWVMFAFFQDCRDAQAGFRENATYRLEQPKMPEDMRARIGRRSTAPSYSPIQRYTQTRWDTPPRVTVHRGVDHTAIWIGNLPNDVTEDKLRELFGRYGRIAEVEIIERPSANNTAVSIFAFITYYTAEEARSALDYRYQLGDNVLRVARREAAGSLARREVLVSRGSPRNRFQADRDTMEMLFQQGVSVGMANANVNASQSPTAAHSLYTPYNSYTLTGVPQFAPIAAPSQMFENDGSPGLHGHAQAFVPQTVQHVVPQGLGQYQMPTITPAQTTHYMPHTHLAQRTSSYQWPPADTTVPKITKEELP